MTTRLEPELPAAAAESVAPVNTGSASGGAPPPAVAGGGMPLDPLRLVAAILRRAWMIAVGGAILGLLAGVVGYKKFTASYKVSAQFIRQESSATFRASELGEPFKPRQMTVQTLVSLLKSPVVMQPVSAEAQSSVDPKLTARAIVGNLTVTPERNTDLITVAFVSGRSAAAAVKVINIFGNTVVKIIKDMQTQEAIEMNRLLKRQLLRTEEELKAANQEELDFAKQAGLINADKEIDAYLRTLGDLDLRLATMKIEFETIDLQMATLERELTNHSPINEKVQIARERLTDLRQEYTDLNPIVLEQQALLQELERRALAAATNPISPPRQGEGGLSTSYYSELVTLRTHKLVVASQLEKMKATRAEVDEKLRGLPEKAMQLVRIKARQQSLEGSRSLLASRQREAQLYEENSPGYYRFFEANTDDVDVSGRSKKVILLAVVGAFLGAIGTLLGICAVELLDDRIKTSADLKRVTKLGLLARLPALITLDAVAQSNWAFRTWLALQSKLIIKPNGGIVLGFVAAGRRQGCSTWIELLARAAAQRHSAVLVVTNRAPINGTVVPIEEALAAPALVRPVKDQLTWLLLPPDWIWNSRHRQLWQELVSAWEKTDNTVVLIEIVDAEQPDNLMLAENVPQLLWVARGGQVRGRDIRERMVILQNARCQFAGAVLNQETKLLPWL